MVFPVIDSDFIGKFISVIKYAYYKYLLITKLWPD